MTFHRFLSGLPGASAFGLLALNTGVRLLGALGAVVLVYAVGAGPDMDRYTTLTLLTTAVAALAASALPTLVAAEMAQQGPGQGIAVGRHWARKLAILAFGVYVGLLPLLAWVFDSSRSAQGWLQLAMLLLPGAITVSVSPLIAAEQAILQASGRISLAVAQSAWTTGTTLAFTFVAVWQHNVIWCAVGLAAGPFLEWIRVRDLNKRHTPSSPLGPLLRAEVPWRRFCVLTAATAGVFFSSLFDQAMLAHEGASMQALWGLATRAPSFLTLSLVAVVGALSTVLVASSQGADCSRLPRNALTMARQGFLASAAVLGTLALAAVPMTRVLFERGAFGPEDTQAVANATRVAVFAFLWYPPLVVLLRAVAARGQYRMLAHSALAYAGVKGLVGWWAVPLFGLLGVAASTGVAMAMQVAVLARALSRGPKS